MVFARRSAAPPARRSAASQANPLARRSTVEPPMTSIPARAIARQYADLRLIQDFFKLVCFTSASSYLEPGQAFTSGKDWHLRSSKSGNRG